MCLKFICLHGYDYELLCSNRKSLSKYLFTYCWLLSFLPVIKLNKQLQAVYAYLIGRLNNYLENRLLQNKENHPACVILETLNILQEYWLGRPG